MKESRVSNDTGEINVEEPRDAEAILRGSGFSSERTSLTRRQAEVFVLREYGFKQAAIADYTDTTRENVSGIEARARENIDKARETVEFAELVSAPVRLRIPADTDLYDLPDMVFDACDTAGIKVGQNAPELMKSISDAAGSAVEGRQVRTELVVNVTGDGTVRIKTA